jgi:hypothetical protein
MRDKNKIKENGKKIIEKKENGKKNINKSIDNIRNREIKSIKNIINNNKNLIIKKKNQVLL